VLQALQCSALAETCILLGEENHRIIVDSSKVHGCFVR